MFSFFPSRVNLKIPTSIKPLEDSGRVCAELIIALCIALCEAL